jgi:hypothetical protein
VSRRIEKSQIRRLSLALGSILTLATFINGGTALAESSAPGTTIVAVVSVSSTSAALSWSVSATTDPIAGFIVSSGPGNELAEFFPPADTGTLSGLTPSTAYNLTFTTIYLKPVPDGADITNNILLTTLAPGTLPPTTTLAPKQSTITSIKSVTSTLSAATIRWVPATYPSHPTKFVIDIFLKGNQVRTQSLGRSARATTIRHLKPRTHYSIILFTYLGTGAISTFGYVITK